MAEFLTSGGLLIGGEGAANLRQQVGQAGTLMGMG
jgi:hypothetical protein